MAKQRELINKFGVSKIQYFSLIYLLSLRDCPFLGRSCCVPKNAERQGAHSRVSYIGAAPQHLHWSRQSQNVRYSTTRTLSKHKVRSAVRRSDKHIVETKWDRLGSAVRSPWWPATPPLARLSNAVIAVQVQCMIC